MIKILIGLITGIIGGFLGSYAGADGTSKNWRRIGVPLLLSLIGYFYLKNHLCFGILLMFIPLSMGYGIPWGTPAKGDNGSLLGRFWYKIINKNSNYAQEKNFELVNKFSKGTIGFIETITLMWMPIIKHNWINYILYGFGIILINVFISWKDLGYFNFFGKKLLWSEFITYLIITLLSTLIMV